MESDSAARGLRGARAGARAALLVLASASAGASPALAAQEVAAEEQAVMQRLEEAHANREATPAQEAEEEKPVDVPQGPTAVRAELHVRYHAG